MTFTFSNIFESGHKRNLAAVDLVTTTRSIADTTQAPQSAALQETTSSDASDFTISVFYLTLSFLAL